VSTVCAPTQVTTVAASAMPTLGTDHARHQRGEDQHRLEAFSEDDDRAVRDHRLRRSRPRPDALLGSCERVVESGACLVERLDRRLALDQPDEAVVSSCAVPEVPLDLSEQIGGDATQTLLRPELEDAVRLQAGGLGGCPVARDGGSL
jgi:hypothetical protein